MLGGCLQVARFRWVGEREPPSTPGRGARPFYCHLEVRYGSLGPPREGYGVMIPCLFDYILSFYSLLGT